MASAVFPDRLNPTPRVYPYLALAPQPERTSSIAVVVYPDRLDPQSRLHALAPFFAFAPQPERTTELATATFPDFLPVQRSPMPEEAFVALVDAIELATSLFPDLIEHRRSQPTELRMHFAPQEVVPPFIDVVTADVVRVDRLDEGFVAFTPFVPPTPPPPPPPPTPPTPESNGGGGGYFIPVVCDGRSLIEQLLEPDPPPTPPPCDERIEELLALVDVPEIGTLSPVEREVEVLRSAIAQAEGRALLTSEENEILRQALRNALVRLTLERSAIQHTRTLETEVSPRWKRRPPRVLAHAPKKRVSRPVEVMTVALAIALIRALTRL